MIESEGNGAATRRSVQCLEEGGWWLQNIDEIRSITVVIYRHGTWNMESTTWERGRVSRVTTPPRARTSFRANMTNMTKREHKAREAHS